MAVMVATVRHLRYKKIKFKLLTAVHFRDTFCFAKSVDVGHTVEEISQFFAIFQRNVKIQ